MDAYIDAAPSAAQPALREIRQLIGATLPSATARLTCGMPTYDLRGQRFVHFAAARSHVGVHGLVHEAGGVTPELEPYLHERSTLRFRLDQPLPAAALAAAIRRKAAQLDEAG